MIKLKTEKEIELMKQGGQILSEVIEILLENTKIGVSLRELDQIAEKAIIKRQAFPSFKLVKGYKWSICGCVNDIVVHGIPDDYVINENDLVGIDCGVFFNGFHTDASWSIRVKKKGNYTVDYLDKFILVGKNTLIKAIDQVKEGNYIYDISKTIQSNIENAGYQIVKSLVGHGIGHDLHEDPEIPGYVSKLREETPRITKGMAMAIEVIYNIGKPEVRYKGDDGWTIVTKDGKISGLFEATVVPTSHGCIVLTKTNYCLKTSDY